MSGLCEAVRARRRRWIAARALESALVGGAAAAAVVAAQRLSGPAAAGAAALPAALCAALAGAALLRERWRDERAFTERLDARVGAGGALATACEARRAGDADGLAVLLEERTARALALARWRGAAAPVSPLSAAALLAGLALLAVVGPPPSPSTWAQVELALGGLEDLASAGTVDAAALSRALERLDGALAAPPLAPAQRREAERRRDAARVRLESLAAAGAAAAGGDAEGVGAQASGAASSGAGATAGSGAPLAAGGGERTMSRPEGPAAVQPQSSHPQDAAARALAWPRRHDEVVAGYLQRRPRD